MCSCMYFRNDHMYMYVWTYMHNMSMQEREQLAKQLSKEQSTEKKQVH